jgi:Flp pilus assembly protein TadG
MAPLNLFRGRPKSERGAELIEFALVLPLLLLVVLGIVDFGFLFQRLEVVTNAAREGARLAVLPGYSTGDVTNRVQDYLQQGGVGSDATNVNPRVDVTGPTDIPITGGGTFKGMQVTVRYFHQYLFLSGIAGWFGGSFSSVPLNATSTMRCEAACGP